MRPRHTTTYRYLSIHSKQWSYRLSVALMLASAMSLFIMGKNGNPAVENMRSSITDVMAPVITVAAAPVEAVDKAMQWGNDFVSTYAHNLSLKQQNADLLKWQAAAKELQAENQALRALLHVVPAESSRYVTARMVSDVSGPFMQAALINGGAAQNIQKDQAIITQEGLVGRTISVGEHSARVLLLNDINSRVPVMGENSREKAILVGGNSGMPSLSYLKVNSKIAAGERLVTSGDGGVFPAGIPVGRVVSVNSETASVRPYVDASTVEYVTAVDYRF